MNIEIRTVLKFVVFTFVLGTVESFVIKTADAGNSTTNYTQFSCPTGWEPTIVDGNIWAKKECKLKKTKKKKIESKQNSVPQEEAKKSSTLITKKYKCNRNEIRYFDKRSRIFRCRALSKPKKTSPKKEKKSNLTSVVKTKNLNCKQGYYEKKTQTNEFKCVKQTKSKCNKGFRLRTTPNRKSDICIRRK